MATISEKLQLALDSKAKIKAAIEEKGGSVTDFASYADAIRNIKGGGEEHSPVRFSAEFVEDYDPYFGRGFTSLFGPSAYAVRKLVICGFGDLFYTDSDFYENVNDLTIDSFTYYLNDNSISVVRIGEAVHNGNLRLEGEWIEIPEKLLDAFMGWELYINGEHIGTIEPKQGEGGYYYTSVEENSNRIYLKADDVDWEGRDGAFTVDFTNKKDVVTKYPTITKVKTNLCPEGEPEFYVDSWYSSPYNYPKLHILGYPNSSRGDLKWIELE